MQTPFGATRREEIARGGGITKQQTYEKSGPSRRLPVRRLTRARATAASRVAALFAAMLILAALCLLFVSDFFYVYEISTQGNNLVTTQEVFGQTQYEGYNIFFIDHVEAQKRIESLPDVRQAHVQLRLPNEMVVAVQERQARLVWQTGDTRFGVDEEGLIVSLGGQTEPETVITDLDQQPLEPGESVDEEAVAAAAVYQDLLPGVHEFQFSAQRGLSYTDELGQRVYLGDANKATLKVAIVGALVNKLADQGVTIESIDVRFPDSPLYRAADQPNP
jgi:cell division septal protein FtsQ